MRVDANRWWVAGMLCAAAALSGCGGPATAPTSFGKHNSKDQAFACEYPEGWDVSSAGTAGAGACSLTVTKGNATVRVRSDVVGSMFGDLAGPGDPNDPEAKPPERKVHEMGRSQIAEEFSNFKETAFQEFPTGLGRTCVSEFTASGSFGGGLHGYYATALGRERRVTVLTTCPDSDWKTLQPAFDRVIRSLAAGRPQ